MTGHLEKRAELKDLNRNGYMYIHIYDLISFVSTDWNKMKAIQFFISYNNPMSEY